MDDIDIYVSLYFSLGMSYPEILQFLARHGFIISLRTLRRKLASLHLFRRKNFTDIMDVAIFIFENVSQPGFSSGYRWMHQKCINYGFTVAREIVTALMKLLDPEGVSLRKRKRLRRRLYYALGPRIQDMSGTWIPMISCVDMAYVLMGR